MYWTPRKSCTKYIIKSRVDNLKSIRQGKFFEIEIGETDQKAEEK